MQHKQLWPSFSTRTGSKKYTQKLSKNKTAVKNSPYSFDVIWLESLPSEDFDILKALFL